MSADDLVSHQQPIAVAGEDSRWALARRLNTAVLTPLKQAFVNKDEIIDLLGVCLAAGENLFLLGPPGTAKTAIVHELGRRIEGRVFDYLLTRFTEPNELFGPFDLRKLRDGELVTNTAGMLPEADVVFLDELLNANSAILNSLLMVLNERVFRRGRETRELPLLMVIGASNRLPEDDALGALFDRFLLRVRSDNVPDDRLADVLTAGWRLEQLAGGSTPGIAVTEVRQIRDLVNEVQLAPVRATFVELITRLRRAGVPVSDRRAVKLQRLVAASAVLCGRSQANATDTWVLRHVWDTEEQREVIAEIVQQVITQCSATELHASHPRALQSQGPDPEELARDLDRIDGRLAEADDVERATLREQLTLLSGRCAWITAEVPRTHLEQRIQTLWSKLGPS